MREEKLQRSWPKAVVRKWLHRRKEIDELYDQRGNAMLDRRRKGSDDGTFAVVPEELSDQWFIETGDEMERPGLGQLSPRTLNLRMMVGTWNVGGKSPHDGLNLREWLKTKAPADIYVLGFQEIVPLNAGNVLGPEDCGPAGKWISLIRRVLNSELPHHCSSRKLHTPTDQAPHSRPRTSFGDLLSCALDSDEDEACENCSPEHGSKTACHRYSLAASKQMVGIFLCVWIREDFYHRISSLKVSCVGRGIMGRLGNKGSISISMTLCGTTFCFVCSHLASGEKGGDAARRNVDVMEILKKTRFSKYSYSTGRKHFTPYTILDHDNIIWLGDLNYRLASSCGDTCELIEKNNWEALLEKDELRKEQEAGRVFKGWKEGGISFAPTYKYHTNSDRYVLQTSYSSTDHKRRTPAWCDRILWRGEGVKQMWYRRGESRFSDHRPVYSLFSVEVKMPKSVSCNSNNTSPLSHLPNYYLS